MSHKDIAHDCLKVNPAPSNASFLPDQETMKSVPNDPKASFLRNQETMGSTSNAEPKAFGVAIVGAGIGGILLAIGLLKYAHVEVHVYESAPSFGEIGAGVAYGPNTQRALELLDPAAKKAFDKHATGNMTMDNAKSFANYVVVSPVATIFFGRPLIHVLSG